MSLKWFRGYTPRKRREKVAMTLYPLIPEDGEISWSELLKKSRLGKATLSRHLKRLESLGLVQRRVDSSTYPPTVFYKRIKEHPALAMPFEVWRAWIGEYPPSREASPETNARWIYAQTLLLLAETVQTLTPPPFVLGDVSDEEILKWWSENNMENHFKMLYERLIEMHRDFCRATMYDSEKLFKVGSMLQFYAFNLREEALRQYGLNLPEVAEKIRGGEAPKPSRPVKLISSKKP